MGKIESMMLHVTSIIDKFRQRQEERVKQYTTALRSKSKDQTEDIHYKMDRFCIAMDNYFTLPKVIATLREKGIGVVGTARFKVN